MSDAYDRLVAALDPGMVVVTVAVEGERDGCLVGFHSQCSIDPPRHAVWLSVANRTQELAQQATHLAVHVLGVEHRELAELFGGETGDDVDKLARCEWEADVTGAPLLVPCAARFVGRIVERTTGGGDHALFVLVADEAGPPPEQVLRLSSVDDVDPGHEADERR